MTSLILATHLHYNHDEFLLSYFTGQMSRWFWSIRTLWYQKLGSSLRLNVEGIIQQTPDAKSRTMKVSLHPLWKKLPSDISRGEREMIYEEVPWINGVAWIQWLGGGGHRAHLATAIEWTSMLNLLLICSYFLAFIFSNSYIPYQNTTNAEGAHAPFLSYGYAADSDHFRKCTSMNFGD